MLFIFCREPANTNLVVLSPTGAEEATIPQPPPPSLLPQPMIRPPRVRLFPFPASKNNKPTSIHANGWNKQDDTGRCECLYLFFTWETEMTKWSVNFTRDWGRPSVSNVRPRRPWLAWRRPRRRPWPSATLSPRSNDVDETECEITFYSEFI